MQDMRACVGLDGGAFSAAEKSSPLRKSGESPGARTRPGVPPLATPLCIAQYNSGVERASGTQQAACHLTDLEGCSWTVPRAPGASRRCTSAGGCVWSGACSHARPVCSALPDALAQPQTNPEALWREASCFAVALPPLKEEDANALRYNKPVALHLWLFGYELPGALLRSALRAAVSALTPARSWRRHGAAVHPHRRARGLQRQERCVTTVMASRLTVP